MIYLEFFIGIMVLFLGVFIGDFLAKVTKEELSASRKWIKLIAGVSLFFGFLCLLLNNDVLMFTFLFIAIVSARNLKFVKKT